MPKKQNRLREFLKETGMKQAQAAELCGINHERFRKILGNRVELLGWELMQIAQAFGVEVCSLYEPNEIDVHTLQKELTASGLETVTPETPWRAALIADNEETLLWLRHGLLQEEHLVEGPGFAWVTLSEGRILIGRAVDQIGTTATETQPDRTIANQLLSIRRKEYEEDRKLSRFQLDVSFSSSSNQITIYVQSSAIKVEKDGKWQIVLAGECRLLHHGDRLRFPNEKVLRVSFTQKSTDFS